MNFMKSRERVIVALRHEEPDRIPIDFGSTYRDLRRFLRLKDRPARVKDVVAQLTDVDAELLEFIKIAQRDFEDAKLLFENGRYPNAIFMLQQSIEKAIKSLLIKLGLIRDEKELRIEISHYVASKLIKLLEARTYDCGKEYAEPPQMNLRGEDVRMYYCQRVLRIEFQRNF